MGKRTICLYIDDNVILECKRRHINISGECENFLRRTIEYKEKPNIPQLEFKLEQEKLRLEQEMKKLNEIKERQFKIEEIIKTPLFKEIVGIVVVDASKAKGSCNRLKNIMDFDISEYELLELVKENKKKILR